MSTSAASYIDIADGDWPSGKTCAELVALFDDGRALIAENQALNPKVRELLAFAEKRLSRKIKREYVDHDAIVEARKLGIAGRRSTDDSKMESAIQDLIGEAQSLRASDIHISVGENITHVQMRIDGVLTKPTTWTADYGQRFLAASYSMADIANKAYSPSLFLAARLAPKAGRDTWAFKDGLEAVRCQYNPVAFGITSAFFRLLGTIDTTVTLESLGYEPEQIAVFDEFADRQNGLCIVSGITGSGKSTALGTLITRQVRQEQEDGRRRSYFAVEDPPERRLNGVHQLVVPNTETEEQRKTAFAETLKAALRSDPDVILIGEIRDRITAQLTIRAAITGHQVWTTLHCISAHEIPARLVDEGVDSALIFRSDILQVAVAQVLVPTLCASCKVRLVDAPADVGLSHQQRTHLAHLGDEVCIEGKGCARCRHTGIKGRTVAAEVIRTDPAYLRFLEQHGAVDAKEFARNRGEPSIADIVVRKVMRGQISARVISKFMSLSELARHQPSLRVVS